MSLRQSSVSQSASRSQHSVRKVRKFKFTDLSLSYQVRKRLYEMLISFDDNVNYQFEKAEIKRALQQILEQSQAEVAYVTNNVFRYDFNHDGVVTYEQFSNFCLEQHFGQMAIQRLHKNNLYSRGKERVMSGSQFASTLVYCLSFIQVHPRKEVIQTIFRDVDLDKDDFITYSDYFTLLKEYFGSQSQSAYTIKLANVEEDLKKTYGNVDKKIIKQQIFKQKIQKLKSFNQNHDVSKQTKPAVSNNLNNNTKTVDSSKNMKKSPQFIGLCQRISRLVNHQLKITLMQYDQKMQLCQDQTSARLFLTTALKLSDLRARQIIQLAFQREALISYEKILKFAVEKVMCQDFIDKISYPVNKQKFILQIYKALFFIRAKPFASLFEGAFQQFFIQSAEGNKSQLKQLMTSIFSQYSWPRKTGELRMTSMIQK